MQAPHRIADAIFATVPSAMARKATKFRESAIGKKLDLLATADADATAQLLPIVSFRHVGQHWSGVGWVEVRHEPCERNHWL